MRVFVYESITGGGTLHASSCTSPNASLLAEGRAMLSAVASDFAELGNTDVVCLWDARLSRPEQMDVAFVPVDSADDETKRFDFYAANSDYTLLVAPELGGELLERTLRVERLRGRLLSADSEFVRLATSKSETISRLECAGVRVPRTVLYNRRLSKRIDLDPPLVVKPDDGAGSIGIQMLEHAIDESDLPERGEFCVQAFCAGQSASVTVLCRPHRPLLFPACWQYLQPPRFQYAGGSVIQDPDLQARATRLVRAAVDALPVTRGLIGIDIVLGEQPDGSADFVIEVNPRLTTSYVGLRCLTDQNLAHAILSASNGEDTTLFFRLDRIEFSACGEVRRR